MKYYQCLLTKNVPGGYIHTIAWLPKKWATSINKKLKLKDDNGNWNGGWVVTMLYGSQEESFIMEHERDWAKQRQASDI